MTDALDPQQPSTPAFTPEPAAEPAPAATPVAEPVPAVEAAEPEENFGDLLRAFEQTHKHKKEPGASQLEGRVVSLSAEQVFFDIGYKTEGVLPRSAFKNDAEGVKPGDAFQVSVKGRNEEHYYVLSLTKVAKPTDWSALEKAFNEKLPVVGTVTGVVKGGLTVDVGVRAFMPASRSGEREAAAMEKLVGTEITCRITKLDTADENVVVDRRGVLEELAKAQLESRRAELEAHWAELAPQWAWWNAMNAFDRIGDLTPPDPESEIIGFPVFRSVPHHALAIASLQAIDGHGDQAVETLLPILKVSLKLRHPSTGRFRSLSGIRHPHLDVRSSPIYEKNQTFRAAYHRNTVLGIAQPSLCLG